MFKSNYVNLYSKIKTAIIILVFNAIVTFIIIQKYNNLPLRFLTIISRFIVLEPAVYLLRRNKKRRGFCWIFYYFFRWNLIFSIFFIVYFVNFLPFFLPTYDSYKIMQIFGLFLFPFFGLTIILAYFWSTVHLLLFCKYFEWILYQYLMNCYFVRSIYFILVGQETVFFHPWFVCLKFRVLVCFYLEIIFFISKLVT